MNPQDHIDRLERKLEDLRYAHERLLDLFEEASPGSYALDVEIDEGEGLVQYSGFLLPSANAVIEDGFAALAASEDDDETED